MKKLLVFVFSIVFFLSAQAAGTSIRINIDGIKEKNKISPDMNVTNIYATRFNWLKNMNDKAFTLLEISKKKISSDWKIYEFTFIPEKTGNVTISIEEGAGKTRDCAWLAINRIEKNGITVENGDFKKSFTAKNGKIHPKGFRLRTYQLIT